MGLGLAPLTICTGTAAKAGWLSLAAIGLSLY
jgi:hypothetical protein